MSARFFYFLLELEKKTLYNVNGTKGGRLKMVLTVDIGNTNIVIGGFLNAEIKFVSRIATDIKKTEDEYAVILRNILLLNEINAKDINGAIISSVVPP